MKNRRMRLMAIFAAGVLSVTSMGGIVTAHAEGGTLAVPQRKQVQSVQMDGKDAQAAEDGSVAASEGSDRRIFQTVRDCSAGTGYL